jgi:hypothetical protein
MNKHILIWLFFIFSLMSSTAIVRASGADTAFSISYLNDNLSADIKNSSLEYVLAQVAIKTGVKFVFNKQFSGNNIYTEFISLPLEKAIQRILNRFNYAMIYTSTGEIQKVIITGNRNSSLIKDSQTNNKLSTSYSDTSSQRSKPEAKNSDAPDGMVLSNFSGKGYDNEIVEGMIIKKQTKKEDSNNIPDGMEITEQPKNVSSNKAPDGMVIPPPPDKKNRKNLSVGAGISPKKN